MEIDLFHGVITLGENSVDVPKFKSHEEAVAHLAVACTKDSKVRTIQNLYVPSERTDTISNEVLLQKMKALTLELAKLKNSKNEE